MITVPVCKLRIAQFHLYPCKFSPYFPEIAPPVSVNPFPRSTYILYINNWLRIFLPWLIAVRMHIKSCVYTCKWTLDSVISPERGGAWEAPAGAAHALTFPIVRQCLYREKHDEMKTQFVTATGQDIIARNSELRFHFPTRRLIINIEHGRKFTHRGKLTAQW